MKTHVFMLSCCVLVLMSHTLTAQISGDLYKCYYPITVKIDGDLLDWDHTLFEKVTNHKLSQKQYWGEDDISFQFACVADLQNLYVGLIVTDDMKLVDQKNGWNLWRDDSFEIYLDTDHNGGIDFDPNDVHLRISRGGELVGSDRGPWRKFGKRLVKEATMVSYKVTETETGWNVELGIPAHIPGLVIYDNCSVGFNIVVNDDDGEVEGHKGTMYEHYLSWSNKDAGHNWWTNLSEFLPLLFGDMVFERIVDL